MDNISIGRQGELLFKEKMEAKGYIVQDVSKNEDFYYKGDFIVTSPTTGLTKIIEVKFDTKIHKTGNLYLELVASHSPGGIGWWEFSKADYLAYGDAKKGVFFMFKMDELRERVKKLPRYIAQCGGDSIG